MSAAAIDLDAYLARIGYDGPRAPSLATLRRLHELHPQSIPFENLDPLLGRPVRLDLAALQAKLVGGGRGGYCYEQNLLFAAALRALGFAVHEHAARVIWSAPGAPPTARIHLLLLVDIDGVRYLADVGFGGNVVTGPLLLEEPSPQQTPHEPFQILKGGERYVLQLKLRDGWEKLYGFDLSEQILPDHEQGNWYVSTHPDSQFVRRLIVARTEAGRRYALSNNVLSTHVTNGASDRRVLTAREVREVLTDLFKVRLDSLAGLDDKLARLAEGTS